MIKTFSTIILFAAIGAGILQAETGTKPNIIVILADDLGWGDVSCNVPEKGKVITPAIDKFASEGMRFTNAHAPHSVCTPTRYSLLTGRYCWRTYVREGVLPGYAKPLIPPTRVTIASALKGQGYATAAFGKWHIGLGWKPKEGDPGDYHFGSQIHGPGANAALVSLSERVDHTASIEGGPLALGFDTFFGTPSNCTRIPVFMRGNQIINEPMPDKTGLIRDPTLFRDTVDDLYVVETKKFIETAVEKNEPFFVYLALNAAHGAVLPPKRFVGKSGIGPRGDRCLWVDESVDKISRFLDGAGISENTLVVFTSDNGPKFTKKELADGHDASGPFRGYKTDAWDGGSRVPFIVRWPGKVPANEVNDNLMSLTDLMPTAASIAGASLPEWAAEDGIDQSAQFLDANAEPVRHSMITQSYTGILSIRRDNWKLIFDTLSSGGFYKYSDAVESTSVMAPWRMDLSQTGQLYNLAEDPYEQTNLYEEKPAKVTALTEEIQKAINSGRSEP
ncbi:arylsulfatase [Verrucomicrobiales bacterium]|nr:arylsulfatase [Verrucomicrobiales bacterium]